MNPITPPASSPAKRKRACVDLDSPVTPTRPRLHIPSPQQAVSNSAMSPRAQVAGRFRNLSIQKQESGPANQCGPWDSEAYTSLQPHSAELESSLGTNQKAVLLPQDANADRLLQQLSNSQKHLLATSSPTPAMLHPPPPPPVQLNPLTLPATPPLQPLTAATPTPFPPPPIENDSDCLLRTAPAISDIQLNARLAAASHNAGLPPEKRLPYTHAIGDSEVDAIPYQARDKPGLSETFFTDLTMAHKRATLNSVKNPMPLEAPGEEKVGRTRSASPSNKAAKTTSFPSPNSKRARSPPPPSMAIDPDEDDLTGVNGIGYRPTPAQAYARAQKRRQQVKEWKAREEREMRGRRAERRRGGAVQGEGKGVADALDKGGVAEAEGERKVRFVGVMG